jgi:hypothetical protein
MILQLQALQNYHPISYNPIYRYDIWYFLIDYFLLVHHSVLMWHCQHNIGFVFSLFKLLDKNMVTLLLLWLFELKTAGGFFPSMVFREISFIFTHGPASARQASVSRPAPTCYLPGNQMEQSDERRVELEERQWAWTNIAAELYKSELQQMLKVDKVNLRQNLYYPWIILIILLFYRLRDHIFNFSTNFIYSYFPILIYL